MLFGIIFQNSTDIPQFNYFALQYLIPEYEEFMRGVNERHPTMAKISFSYNRQMAKKIYAGADFLLNIASVEPCGLCPLIANKYGTLPVVYATGGIKDNIKDFKHFFICTLSVVMLISFMFSLVLIVMLLSAGLG